MDWDPVQHLERANIIQVSIVTKEKTLKILSILSTAIPC